GHYDVQPVGDERLWTSPPFEPELRDGAVFARGAADDKGQVLTHLMAAEAWMKTAGRMPVRVKYLIEGEEEVGSKGLGPLIRDQQERLACDYVVISDTAKLDADTPAITYGTKGMVYKEIILTGPSSDLHSGSFGGTVFNPANVLAKIIAGLKDDQERVTIPGFYDAVRPASAEEKAALAHLPFDEGAYLTSTGSPALTGEAGFSTLERRWLRPTLDVNGLLSGFTGQGASTIIPARAMAKVSMRIVPDQEPEAVSEAFDRAVRALTPKGVRLEVKTWATAAAYLCPIDSPGIQAARVGVEAGYGTPPALIREGGTLPILPMFREVLGAESIMMGFCVPDCHAHGPNEFFAVEDLICGTRSIAHFLQALAKPAA
ncbi:MAG: M20/M25/M40 family metallo-hydrolase, partial [Planctomycetes bacterium]|nr:M20/M25/M40 family metallo-hydrolase [Planctomycetota bacterium]